MLSLEEVERLARLARLALGGAEAERLRAELNGILAMIDEMRAVDTSGVAPLAHPQALHQRLRADAITESVDRSRFQAVAPAVEDGLYLVPKVLE